MYASTPQARYHTIPTTIGCGQGVAFLIRMNTVETIRQSRENLAGRPPRRPPGRPPKDREVDKAAAVLAEKHEVPDPPAKTIGFDQMQEWFKLLTPEMWSHLMVYCYRLRPRIIRQLKDPDLPNYIDCLSQPFN